MLAFSGEAIAAALQIAIERVYTEPPHFTQWATVDMPLKSWLYNAIFAFLDGAEALLPGAPMVYYYRAQVYLQSGENEKALEYARKANQADITMLLGYRVLAEAAVLNGEYEESLKAIKTYLAYEKKDPQAWLIQGEALFATGLYSETITSVTQALALSA